MILINTLFLFSREILNLESVFKTIIFDINTPALMTKNILSYSGFGLKFSLIIKKYGNDIQDLFNSNINIAINNNNEKLNTLNLQLHKLELDRQNIDPKLEELSETEELLELTISEIQKRKGNYPRII